MAGAGDADGSTIIEGATTNTKIGNTGDRLRIESLAAQAGFNPQLDAFGRNRISSPETVTEFVFRYGKPGTWTESTASGGTVTHDADKVSVVLACTTTTNSNATYQCRKYTHYQPGTSQLVQISGNFIETATNVTKRIGYFDANNGLFFQLAGSTLSVVRRTKTSGSVVDNVTAQSSWNIDKLDGTGTSGLTIDVTKQQIFIIDFKWLGSGRIRYGFYISGAIRYCHEEYVSNVLTVPYSQSGDAPVRAEITNASATASSMHITGCAVVCENGWNPQGQIASANTGSTERTIGSNGVSLPMVSIRKASANISSSIQILDAGVFGNTDSDLLILIIANPTLTGASWVSNGGITEKDQSATSYTGGTVLYSLYQRTTSAGDSILITEIFRQIANTQIGADLAGASGIVTLAVTNIGGGTAKGFGVINYRELI